MVHFWASEVSENKATVVKVPEGHVLNVCNATLASATAAGVVSLGVETTQLDNKAWKGVVAHLGAAAHAHQVKLDLVFGGAAPQLKFYVASGVGKINLTGYFQPGPPADATAATTKQSSKKRARDEPVTWDQAASSSDSNDSDEPKSSKPVAPIQPKQPKQKKPATQQPAAVVGSSATDGAGKKKHRNNKNKNKSKPVA